VPKQPTKPSTTLLEQKLPAGSSHQSGRQVMASTVSATKFSAMHLAVGNRGRNGTSTSMAGDNADPQDALRSIALVNRLLEVEERVQGLVHANAQLRRNLAARSTHGSTSGVSFDVPRTTHEWPLADNATVLPKDLGLYDRRCDDEVVIAGRIGAEFLAKFHLLGDEPNFSGAIAAVNSMERTLHIASMDKIVPDVSIVIPIYGQLAYTLNCIHSLITHKSRYSVEIIVVDDASPDKSGECLPQVQCIRYHRQRVNGGFILSCNTGAEISSGRFVIMLNNDTRVTSGWLDNLIGSFDTWPNAGLVGSKMHYADGSLQEAGGIVWRDGSAWNYGRNDDPNRPQYSYARQVDYVSGCSIALPTKLWRDLGGFDPFYRPAYCEDVDLAFRVRACGREVWFQPQSRIVHYEGKSSGTSTAAGIKAYQIINTKKLFFRWRESLIHHRPPGEAPFLERERTARKRFLVVDATTPTPDQDAGSVQTFMALQTCVALGYKTHFVPEDNWLYQPKYTSAMQAIGVDCAFAPYEIGFEKYIRLYGWLFDVILAYRVGVVEKILPLARRYAPQAAVMFHVADLHYLRMERTAQLSDDSDMRYAASVMKERELSLVKQVDCTISHSSAELNILTLEAPRCPVALWPLMFEYFGTERAFYERRDLCFLGGYRHAPNVDAVIYFANEIFPLIKSQEPEIRFIIAGAHPPEEVRALAGNGVVVTGMVDDLRDLFDPCRVFVCPLRVGAGVKGKVASALSYGIPVVSTELGVEGTELKHGKQVLIAESPLAFAEAVLRLYRDPDLWGSLSRAGQDLVKETLSLEMGKVALAHAVDTAIAHKLGLGASDTASV
jgi:O-antigen biosynthesis protein